MASRRRAGRSNEPGGGGAGGDRELSTFVLVHGSWYGAWCWEKVLPLLRAEGHRAEAPDLPGHGENGPPLLGNSMDVLVDEVVACLDEQAEPVILVGHSFGGIFISLGAEARPERVALLVYVAAFLPRDGQSLLDLVRSDESDNLVLPNLIVSEAEGSVRIRDQAVRSALFHDCRELDVRRAVDRLVPEPIRPRTTPVSLTPAKFGRIPRAYIETLEDRAIPISLQRKMVADSPCTRVETMRTGHSPFYAAPHELARFLLSLA